MTEKEKPKVFVAVPALDHRTNNSLASRIIRLRDTQYFAEIEYTFIDGFVPHDAARNVAVKMAETVPGITHMWFVDNDVIPPPGALNKLLAHKKPVISAVVPHVKYMGDLGEIYMMAWKHSEKGKYDIMLDATGLQRVDAVNAACLLVEMRVFEKVKAPFRFRYNDDGCVNLSEEFVFSERCTEAGFELWTDFDIECDHHRRASLLSLYRAKKEREKNAKID